MRSNQHSTKHFDMTSAQRVATHIPQASRILIVAAVLGSALCFSLTFGFPNSSSPAAFTGAQGGGAASRGGRGGEICEVTNLNDSGINSARDCLPRRNPRTVIFRVA